MNDVKASLERKLGPLPAWAWAVIAGTALYWWRNRGATNASSQPAATAAGSWYPASSGPPAGAGRPARFPRPKRHRKPKRPRKPKPPAGRKHPPHQPKRKPKAAKLIPGRKLHPHDRLQHRLLSYGAPRSRTAGLKTALLAPVRVSRPSAAHPAHDRAAIRGRLHAAPVRTRGPLASAEAVHLVPSSTRGLAGVTVGYDRAAVTRQPAPAAPAASSARRSHADAPAHQDMPAPLRQRVHTAAPSAGQRRP